ncbi:MAG: hypothetical protein ACE10B_06535, partial [Phycisphaerales bacterium]
LPSGNHCLFRADSCGPGRLTAAESIVLEVIRVLVHLRPKPRANAEISWNVKWVWHWEHSSKGSFQGGQAGHFESTYAKVAQVLDEGSA